MRAYDLLLLVILGLILTFHAILAADVETRKSKMEVSKSGTSTGNNIPFLHSHKTQNIKHADQSMKNEDRAGQGILNKFLGRNDLTMKKLSRMMYDEAFKLKMFKAWDKHQQSVGKISEKMFLELNPHYKKLLFEYLNEYQHLPAKVKLFKPRNGQKRPTVNRVGFADPLATVNKFDADP